MNVKRMDRCQVYTEVGDADALIVVFKDRFIDTTYTGAVLWPAWDHGCFRLNLEMTRTNTMDSEEDVIEEATIFLNRLSEFNKPKPPIETPNNVEAVKPRATTFIASKLEKTKQAEENRNNYKVRSQKIGVIASTFFSCLTKMFSSKKRKDMKI